MALIVEVNNTSVQTENSQVQNVITNAPDSASFTMVDPASEPTAGQSVFIYREATTNETLLRGTITRVIMEKIAPSVITANRKFRYNIFAEDFQRQLDRTLVAQTYTSQTCLQIITDFVNNFTDPAMGFTVNNVSTGPTIDEAVFNYRRVSDSIRDLARLVNYEWYVDENKDIHFFEKETLPAPFDIDDNAVVEKITNFSVSIDNTQIRNRVFVRGGFYLASAAAETFTGDGERRIFILGHKPHNITALSVNAVAKTFALDHLNADDGTYEYLWNYNERYIRATDFSPEATPADGHVISVTYQAETPIIVRADNLSSQTALAAIEGGTGIYESILKDETIDTRDLAHDRAIAEVNEFGNAEISGFFETSENGFRAGEFFNLDITGYETYDGNYQIKRVTMIPAGSDAVLYSVEFGTTLYELKDLIAAMLRTQQRITLREDELVDILKIVDETITVNDGDAVNITFSDHPIKWGDAVAADAKWNLATWGLIP